VVYRESPALPFESVDPEFLYYPLKSKLFHDSFLCLKGVGRRCQVIRELHTSGIIPWTRIGGQKQAANNKILALFVTSMVEFR